MPKVSICVPTYGKPDSVERLLASVGCQAYRDFEVIVTDNTRDDSLNPVLDKYSGNFSIHYHKNEENLGPVKNWNAALNRAAGEYVKIMFSDDWFSAESSLTSFVDLLENGSSFAFSGTHQVSNSCRYSRAISDRALALLNEDVQNLYFGNYIGCPSATIFRRSDLRFDERLKWIVDLEFYMRYLAEYKRFSFTEKPLVSIGIDDSQMTNSCENDVELNLREYKIVQLQHGFSEKSYLRTIFHLGISPAMLKKFDCSPRCVWPLYLSIRLFDVFTALLEKFILIFDLNGKRHRVRS
jgi:glycosyltransferase involved in cell wall biosynthesis